ncbi:MAG: hypothetical protein GX130_11195 [Candidatus Hydrogenedens sp.]|jgi:hypothetical protein|nr:hypothetical protein [Candidatus Hydrogenedens sp.]
MRKELFFTILLAFSLTATASCSQEADEQHALPPFGEKLPEGYTLIFENDFSTAETLENFQFTDSSTWRLDQRLDTSCLNLFKGVGNYKPPVRSPFSFALLNDIQVQDFILEMDVESSDLRGGNHRDACFIFGFTEADSFYYAHVAAAADPHSHNIFVVDKEPRVKFASYNSPGISWGTKVRNRIRLERSLSEGRIAVYFNDMTTPVLEGEDKRFTWGHVGIGSFDNSCCFYEMKLYAPDFKEEKSPAFFNKD